MFSIQLCVCRIKLPRWPQRPTAQSSTPLWTRSGSSAPMPDAAIDFFTLLLHPMLHRRLGAKDALAHVYLQGCLPQMLDDFVVPKAAISTTGQLQLGCSMCHQARCQWVTTLLFQTCQRTFHPTATQSAIQQFLWGHPLWMLHPPCHSLTIP